MLYMRPRVLPDRSRGSKLLIGMFGHWLMSLLGHTLIVERCFVGGGKGWSDGDQGLSFL